MGWFLSRSSSTDKTPRVRRAAAASRGAAEASWNPARTLLALKVLGLGGVLAGLGVGWRNLEAALGEYVTQTRSRPAAVVLADRPDWMSDADAAAIRELAMAQLSEDPMDRVGLMKAAGALSHSTWVDQLTQVRRLSDGRVIVEATYRRPVAAVKTEHGYCIVDAQGVWLATEDPAHLSRLAIITGVAAAPPRIRGQVWQGEDIAAALALAQLLRDEPYMSQVASIDASQRDTRGRVRLVLVSHTQHQVVWGLAPGQERMVEPEAAVKLARLRRVVRASGTVDAAGRGVMLNGATIMTVKAE